MSKQKNEQGERQSEGQGQSQEDLKWWRAIENILGAANLGAMPNMHLVSQAESFVKQRGQQTGPVMKALTWLRQEREGAPGPMLGGAVLQMGMRSAGNRVRMMRERLHQQQMHRERGNNQMMDAMAMESMHEGVEMAEMGAGHEAQHDDYQDGGEQIAASRPRMQ